MRAILSAILRVLVSLLHPHVENLVIGYKLIAADFPATAAWLRQTSTIIGICGVVGILMSVLGGTLLWAQALPALAASLTAMLMPGHPDAADAVRAAAADAVALSDATKRATALRDLPAHLGDVAEQLGVDAATVHASEVAVELVVTAKAA